VPIHYVILPVAALVTAALSGMLGMGGGMLLLAAMFCFLSHGEAIPAHAAVQLISNSTRTLAFMRHVDWHTVRRFVLGVVPGSVGGVFLVYALGMSPRTEPYLKALVGLYILTALAVPTRSDAKRAARWWDFPLLGLVAGLAAFAVGAVGPLIAPLFARRAFAKERLIATKAVCQSLLHVAKIPVFLMLRSYPDLSGLGLVTVAMGVLVIPGTFVGKQCLRGLSERTFLMLYRLALLAAGLKLLLWDGLPAFTGDS
jgi:uncharacterized membrane protein YfcA